MIYFYYRKVLKCYLKEHQPFTAEQLHIEFEFTHASQEDGHVRWHGDDKRDFAEFVIDNIDIQPIIDVLKENNINGFRKTIGPCGIDVKKTDRFEYFMPVYHANLCIQFLREEDTHKSLANQLINSIPWQVAKEGIYIGKSYSGDWEFGEQGKNQHHLPNS